MDDQIKHDVLNIKKDFDAFNFCSFNEAVKNIEQDSAKMDEDRADAEEIKRIATDAASVSVANVGIHTFKLASFNTQRMRLAAHQKGGNDTEQLLDHWFALGAVLSKCDAILLQEFDADSDTQDSCLQAFNDLLTRGESSPWTALPSIPCQNRCHVLFLKAPVELRSFRTLLYEGDMALASPALDVVLHDPGFGDETATIRVTSLRLSQGCAEAELAAVEREINRRDDEPVEGVRILAGDFQHYPSVSGFEPKIPENVSTSPGATNSSNILLDCNTDRRLLCSGGILRLARNGGGDGVDDGDGVVVESTGEGGLTDLSPLTLVIEECVSETK